MRHMTKLEDIWREQCAATDTIRSRHGERAALDYLIGEKLLLFTSTARTRPEFAAQLPAFVGRVRQIFSREVILGYVAELERRLTEESRRVDADDVYLDSAAISDLTGLRQIGDFLRAENLGTA
jgi:hypothetical protein